MDPFQRLPVELMLQILEDTADFVGVESLTSVPRPARAAFHMDSWAIMHVISALNPITSQPEVRVLISNIVVVHKRLHKTTLVTEELEASQRAWRQEIACFLLHIAAQIQRLACVCLSRLRQEFASAVGASPLHAQRANGPFSWIEEYRIYWARWHLRSYSDVHKFKEEQFSVWETTGRLKSRFSRDIDVYPTSDGVFDFLKEAIWAVAITVEDLQACSPSEFPQRVLRPEHRSILSWNNEIDTPFFTSFELPRSTETQYPIWSPPPVPTQNLVTSCWFLLPDHCKQPPAQMSLFRSLRFQVMRRGTNKRGMDDILRYRRCGVLLWDKWRMFSTGLYPNTFRERVPTPDGGFVDPGGPEARLSTSCLEKWLAVRDPWMQTNGWQLA
ncbi:unnamed protein product [Penicillium olsonii]|uniref:Uncharacterized protein n=1 Tax=Penicillium olsonii TaxID=99116 RepID=A0A9W4HI48_PENOL|nr:unnamed protein product [Penicillium olsonii]CAG8069842.1 unnamed protein product [Penicillium olsonii]